MDVRLHVSRDEALVLARRGVAVFSAEFPLRATGQSWEIAGAGLASSAVALCRSMVALVDAGETEGLGAILRVLVERVVVGQYLLHGDQPGYDALLRSSWASRCRSAGNLNMPEPSWAWGGTVPLRSDVLGFKALTKGASDAMTRKGCPGPWVKELAEALYPFECLTGVHTNVEEVMGAFIRPVDPAARNRAFVLAARDQDFASERLINATALCCTLVQCCLKHAAAEAPAIDSFVEEFADALNRSRSAE